MKDFISMLFGERKPEKSDLMQEALWQNIDAKQKLLHKADRAKTAFDDLADSLTKKRNKR